MKLVVENIKWIMLVSGALTCTMVYAAFAPQAALLSTFGETLDGPLAEIVVRNWGALIALIGAMLIYGAFKPRLRSFVLIAAGASKLVFVALVLSQGGRYLGHQAGIAIAVDLVWVTLFTWYLLSAPSMIETTTAPQGRPPKR
jgi:hypothetical protein